MVSDAVPSRIRSLGDGFFPPHFSAASGLHLNERIMECGAAAERSSKQTPDTCAFELVAHLEDQRDVLDEDGPGHQILAVILTTDVAKGLLFSRQKEGQPRRSSG